MKERRNGETKVPEALGLYYPTVLLRAVLIEDNSYLEMQIIAPGVNRKRKARLEIMWHSHCHLHR